MNKIAYIVVGDVFAGGYLGCRSKSRGAVKARKAIAVEQPPRLLAAHHLDHFEGLLPRKVGIVF
jgi:hypothetical protein